MTWFIKDLSISQLPLKSIAICVYVINRKTRDVESALKHRGELQCMRKLFHISECHSPSLGKSCSTLISLHCVQKQKNWTLLFTTCFSHILFIFCYTFSNLFIRFWQKRGDLKLFWVYHQHLISVAAALWRNITTLMEMRIQISHLCPASHSQVPIICLT